jgi:hypothetical protein
MKWIGIGTLIAIVVVAFIVDLREGSWDEE